MSDANDQLREANWDRMRESLTRAATEYRQIADGLDTIEFVSASGIRRSPDSVISQAAFVANSGRAYSDLMHRLAIWAESINEIERHAAHGATSSRILCPVTKVFGDETWTCVLSSGHSGPERKGVLAHMTASGSEFYA